MPPCRIGLRLCACAYIHWISWEARQRGKKVLARLRTRMRVPMDGHFRAYRAALALAIVDLTVAGCSCGEELMIFESSHAHAHAHARHFLPFRRIPPQANLPIALSQQYNTNSVSLKRDSSNSVRPGQTGQVRSDSTQKNCFKTKKEVTLLFMLGLVHGGFPHPSLP
jgi:hypothetical protein